MANTLTMQVLGLAEAMHAMRQVPMKMQNFHVRVALNKAGGIVKRDAQPRIVRQTGLLKRSIRVKVKVPSASYNQKHHSRPAYAVIGPGRNILGPVARVRKRIRVLSIKKAVARVLGGGKVRTRYSSRYAHLIEFGHYKRGGLGRVDARPFLQPAISATRDTAAAAAIAKLREGLKQPPQMRPVQARRMR